MITTATSKINNDIYLGDDGNLQMFEDINAIENIARNVVRTFLGELPYNQQKGIPYLQTIFASRPLIPVWQSYMVDALQAIQGVTRVLNFNLTSEENMLSYNLTLQTIYGQTTIQSIYN